MTIKFKILEVHPQENSIVVKFYDDIMTEERVQNRTTYSINLPIPTPKGKSLIDFILTKAPIDFFKDMEAVVYSKVDLSDIHSLVDIEHVHTHPMETFLKKKEQVKYTILEFMPDANHAAVKYFTDDDPDGITLMIRLDLVNGEHPDPDQTNTAIMAVAPVMELDKISITKKNPPIVPIHLHHLVKKPHSNTQG
jgi:hypothetical protein